MQTPQHQPPRQRKQPPAPKPCIAAVSVAAATADIQAAFCWQPLGSYPSKRQARAAVDDYLAAHRGKPAAFLILRQRERGASALFDLLADTIQATEQTA